MMELFEKKGRSLGARYKGTIISIVSQRDRFSYYANMRDHIRDNDFKYVEYHFENNKIGFRFCRENTTTNFKLTFHAGAILSSSRRFLSIPQLASFGKGIYEATFEDPLWVIKAEAKDE